MKAVSSILVFIAASATCALALAFPAGGLSPAVAGVSFLAGGLLSVLAWRATESGPGRRMTPWDALMLVVMGLASLRAFLWLIYPVGDEWRVLSPNNLGDLSIHLHLIRYLAGGVDFWPASPILSGSPLAYPIGTDLLNALLLCLGIPVEKGLIWAGLLGAGLAGWSLWRWGGAFALAALLFNGGLSGLLLFQEGAGADPQASLAWKNFFLSMFVTQRGLLYALPCGLFLLSVWRDDFFGGKPGVPAWIPFLLYTTLPLFNAHAFVFLSLVLAAAFWTTPARRRYLLAFVTGALLPASALVYFITGRFSAGGGLHWAPGWMQEGNAWLFWLWNFGMSLPLLLLLAVHLARTRQKEALCFAGTGLLVFFACCFVSLARWEWDNTKLFLWAWLACAPFLGEMISRWPLPSRALIVFVLFFSGAVSLADGLGPRHGYKLASRSELARVGAALAQVPPQDRILIEPDYNNPVILLGRPVYCGYEGHLWSHGLNYQKQWNSLQKVLNRSPGWLEELETIDARWIYLKSHPESVMPLPRPPQ